MDQAEKQLEKSPLCLVQKPYTVTMPKKRNGSRSGFDYATYSEARGFHRGAPPLAPPGAPPPPAHAPGYYHGAYTMQPYYPPSTPAYHPVYNGYLNSG